MVLLPKPGPAVAVVAGMAVLLQIPLLVREVALAILVASAVALQPQVNALVTALPESLGKVINFCVTTDQITS